MKAQYKYAVGQTLTLGGMFRAKVIGLDIYHSEALNMDLPKYKVQTFLGSTDILSPDVQSVHEHQLSVSR